MKVKFWGTRGSISVPGQTTLKFGGHTSCVQIITNDGTQIILDCGTGAHGLGAQLAREGRPVGAHIFISHTHWDHIQGLPFFTPMFIPGNDIQIYGPRELSASTLMGALRGQMQYTYFPITIEAFEASVQYHDLGEESFMIGDVRVTTQYMNHPAVTLGYRIEADGATLVYCTDHEPFDRSLGAGGCPEPLSADDKHCAFMRGADLLIHDCQYTAEEYAQKAGWGHSTVEYVIDMAMHAQVQAVAFFHHDPMRCDTEVERMVEAGVRRVEENIAKNSTRSEGNEGAQSLRSQGDGAQGSTWSSEEGRQGGARRLQVTGAREQHSTWLGASGEISQFGPSGRWLSPEEAEDVSVLEPGKRASTQARTPTNDLQRLGGDSHQDLRLVLFVTDEGVRECVCAALQTDARVVPYFADSVEDFYQLVQMKRPPLVVLGKAPQGGTQDGLAIVQRVKQQWPDTHCVLACEDGQRVRGHPEVDECLQWPFSERYARTRIIAMLLRQEVKWVAPDKSDDEQLRLSVLRGLNLLNTPPEPRYDTITNLCTLAFQVPYAFITLVDLCAPWFKSVAGNVPACVQISRDESFCGHTILQDGLFEVTDATKDPRFGDNPLVTGALRVRFYAGIPLCVSGQRVGTLCILDDRPKKLSQPDVQVLEKLALCVTALVQSSPEDNGAPAVAAPSITKPRRFSSPAGSSAPKTTGLSIRRNVSSENIAVSEPSRGNLSAPKSLVCSVQ